MEGNILKDKIHKFVKIVYEVTNGFPKNETYGLVSQIRRAAVSVMLNYLEGFARQRPKVVLNFYEISYGSIKECKYIIYLSYELNYINQTNYNNLINLADELSAMLWKTKQTIRFRIDG